MDVLRLCHATPASAEHAAIFAFVVKGGLEAAVEAGQAATAAAAPAPASGERQKRALEQGDAEEPSRVLAYLGAVQEAKGLTAADEQRMVALIRGARLRREHVPSQLLSSVPVWTALLERMPLTALTRNLAKLSSIGLVVDGSEAAAEIVRRLGDGDALRRARVHPMSLLFAHRTYLAGRGEKGKLTWSPCAEVVSALDRAFHLAFKTLVPAGKRFCLALDVSGSMCVGINGSGGYGGSGSSLSCREASAAMALVTLETEPACETMCFSHTFQPLPLRRGMGLRAATDAVSGLPFGGTDCSLPMQWALQQGRVFDVFVVYTDSETYMGSVHPCETLRQYRPRASRRRG